MEAVIDRPMFNFTPPPRQWLTPEPEVPPARNPGTTTDWVRDPEQQLYWPGGYYEPTTRTGGVDLAPEASGADGPAHLSIGRDEMVPQPTYGYAPREFDNNMLIPHIEL